MRKFYSLLILFSVFFFKSALSQLSGTYTINPALPASSTNYQTFAAATTALSAGVSGPVIFNVSAGNYAEGVGLGAVTGASATNTITFKNSGAVTLNPVGTAGTGDVMVFIDGADYLIFDGINLSDGGTSAADQNEYGYYIRTAGGLGADGATNNIIRNCTITMGGGGAVLTNGTFGVVITNTATATAPNSNNSIRNVTVNRATFGVYMIGQQNGTAIPTAPDVNNEVSGCTFGNTTALGNNLASSSPIAILAANATGVKIFNNTISDVTIANAANTGVATGITLQNVSGNIYSNKILKITQGNTTSTTTSVRAIGITVGAISSGIVKVYNNFITGITRSYTGAAVETPFAFGIRSTNFNGGGGTSEYYYNTIYMATAAPVPYGSVAFGSFAGGVQMTTKNNIFYNNISTTSATARSVAIWNANTVPNTLLTSDMNDLYAPGTNGAVGGNGNNATPAAPLTYSTTLTDWKTANASTDVNSVSINVNFTNAATGDLHLSGASTSNIQLAADPISGITTDIDNQSRSSFNPFMGADEAAGPLPVQLISFSGAKDGRNNKLQWSTSSESNNRGFELERSADGKNFSSIAFVQTKAENGTSNSTISYSFSDERATNATTYYRLKQLDRDGKITYSSATVVIKGDKYGLEISAVYPNPARERINLSITSGVAEKASISITDLNGRVVKQLNINLNAGDNYINLDINSLASGSYVIRLINSQSEPKTAQFIKN
jgi:hypothetical protein